MWLYKVNHALGPLLGAYWRLGLHGEVAAIPRTGGLLVAANHSSFLDPWFIGMALPFHRHVRWLINHRWYYRSPAWTALFRAFGTLPVRQGDPTGTVDAIRREVERGGTVGIFPEGRVSRDGRLQRFHSGAAHAAACTGAPVLPVGVRGAFRSLPPHRRFPRPTRVEVHVGAPIFFERAPLPTEPSSERIHRFNERLLQRIRTLADQPR